VRRRASIEADLSLLQAYRSTGHLKRLPLTREAFTGSEPPRSRLDSVQSRTVQHPECDKPKD
jgi:hypothetical protein